ncbi:12493_t:CDS:2, partial [Acaulospora morrowiae]
MPVSKHFVHWFTYLVATFASILIIFFIFWTIVIAFIVGAFLPITGIVFLIALIFGLIGFDLQLPDEPFDGN